MFTSPSVAFECLLVLLLYAFVEFPDGLLQSLSFARRSSILIRIERRGGFCEVTPSFRELVASALSVDPGNVSREMTRGSLSRRCFRMAAKPKSPHRYSYQKDYLSIQSPSTNLADFLCK